jgi:hypothetical protein
MDMRPLFLAGLAVLGGCAPSPRVNFDFDPAANFSNFRSYSWAYVSTPRGINPLLFERVKGSIDRTLQGRGYQLTEKGEFAVAFTLGSRDRVEVTDFGSYGPFFSPWGGPWGRPRNIDVRNVTDGTLVIDIYDTTTKRPVWHGTATQQITRSRIDQGMIDTAVNAVLANFPPPPPRK